VETRRKVAPRRHRKGRRIARKSRMQQPTLQRMIRTTNSLPLKAKTAPNSWHSILRVEWSWFHGKAEVNFDSLAKQLHNLAIRLAGNNVVSRESWSFRLLARRSTRFKLFQLRHCYTSDVFPFSRLITTSGLRRIVVLCHVHFSFFSVSTSA
jgi:signal recognition particle subunit SEC65